MSHRLLGFLVLGWAVITWGGRVALLVNADAASVIRVGLSIPVAVAAGVVLIRRRPGGRTALWTYATVTAVVWLTSLVSVWRNDHALGFRLVHTGLAAVSLAFAVEVALKARAVPGTC